MKPVGINVVGEIVSAVKLVEVPEVRGCRCPARTVVESEPSVGSKEPSVGGKEPSSLPLLDLPRPSPKNETCNCSEASL